MNIDNEVKKIKQCRVELDAALQNIRNLDDCRESSIAITKIQEAIMWLGMDLKRIGNPNPYPESYNPESSKVEPTADGLKL